MSTTFGIVFPETQEVVEIAYRSNNHIVWKSPIAHLLPNKTKVTPLDNTAQGIYTIGDIKKEIRRKKKTKMKNKIVYIAHPVGGDIKENLEKIKKIGRDINMKNKNIIPFANYFFDLHCLDDNIPSERKKGMDNNEALLKKGFIDELWLYGDTVSRGMQKEINIAKEVGIKVVPKSKNIKRFIKKNEVEIVGDY